MIDDDIYEPSPEEIRQKCEEIQATWSDVIRDSRFVGDRHCHWDAPRYPSLYGVHGEPVYLGDETEEVADELSEESAELLRRLCGGEMRLSIRKRRI